MGQQIDSISTEQLGHLGLVAAVIRDLGIDKKIDARLPLAINKGGIVPHGTRAANAKPECVGYQIRSTMSTRLEAVSKTRQVLGRFILATNQLDETLLPDAAILAQYKEQTHIESGFGFMNLKTAVAIPREAVN